MKGDGLSKLYDALSLDELFRLRVRAMARGDQSAKPWPPVDFSAPFSKVKNSPLGSASAGVGCPTRRQRSMIRAWSGKQDHKRITSNTPTPGDHWSSGGLPGAAVRSTQSCRNA